MDKELEPSDLILQLYDASYHQDDSVMRIHKKRLRDIINEAWNTRATPPLDDKRQEALDVIDLMREHIGETYYGIIKQALKRPQVDVDEKVLSIAQSIQNILDGDDLMEKWQKHTGVKDLESLMWWVKINLKECLILQGAKNSVGELDIGDWTLGKISSFSQMASNLRTVIESQPEVVVVDLDAIQKKLSKGFKPETCIEDREPMIAINSVFYELRTKYSGKTIRIKGDEEWK